MNSERIIDTVKTLRLLGLVALSLVLMVACDTGEVEEPQKQLESVEYEMWDGSTVTVILDPQLVHEPVEFESEDQYDAYLLDMEAKTRTVTLNSELYKTLGHYFDPYEISVFNNDFTYQVADLQYKADGVAIYLRNEGEKDWEMELYYGEDGNVDSEETSMIYAHRDNEESLSDYKFKSPSAKKIYEVARRKGRNEKLEGYSQGTTILAPQNFDGDPLYHSGNEYTAYIVEYLSNRTGELARAKIRVLYYNEEYRFSGKRARGGTEIQIKDITTNGHFTYGQYVTPWRFNYDQIGNRPISEKEKVLPYTYLKVYSKKWREHFGNFWRVEIDKVPRRSSQKVHSRHRVNFRRNGSTVAREVFHMPSWN